MLSNSLISINKVSKLFRKQNQRTLKELIPAVWGKKKAFESFWALKDINIEIKKGETLGIIGPNGSGKSTLLKLIAGVSQPTGGVIKINGKIAPLIELGAGFHPELSGRENVYLNGVILGMNREEIDSKFEEIVDFAQLWEFIDQPIKHYSSGMYLRLAFSVAVHTDPDILLIDEILAVGDVQFQAKCLSLIQEMVNRGVTLIIVSHDISLIEKFCKRAAYIEKGHLVYIGKSREAVARINQKYFNKSKKSTLENSENNQSAYEWGDNKVRITDISLEDLEGLPSNVFLSDTGMVIHIAYDNYENIDPLHCAIGIYREDDTYISGFNTFFDQTTLPNNKNGNFLFKLEPLYLNKAKYYLRVCLYSNLEIEPHHFIDKAKYFSVENISIKSRGAVNMPHKWEFN